MNMSNHRILVYFAAFYSLLLITAAALKSENIVGNLFAKPYQFKYVVSVRAANSHICGGSIIADEIVLTAAHCFIHKDGKYGNYKYNVVAGTIDKCESSLGTTRDIVKIYVKKGHKQVPNGEHVHDVAVARLREGLGVGSNPHLAVLKLPPANYEYKNFMEGVVTGFGWDMYHIKISNGKRTLTGTADGRMRYGAVKLVLPLDDSKPMVIYGTAVQRFDGIFTGICRGDSGSGIVDGRVVYAITNSAFSCDQTNDILILTRVAPYVSFITDCMNNQPPEDTDIYIANKGMLKTLGRVGRMVSIMFGVDNLYDKSKIV